MNRSRSKACRTPGSPGRALENALRFEQYGTVDHLSVDLNRARGRVGRGEHPLRPCDFLGTRSQRPMQRRDLPRVDAELGAESARARKGQVGKKLVLIVDIGSNSRDRCQETCRA